MEWYDWKFSVCLWFVFGVHSSPVNIRQVYESYDASVSRDTYLRQREALLQADENMRIGNKIVLDENERRANTILMHYKTLEINKSRASDTPFPPSIHFFQAKPLIEKSKVFQIIKKMPKGGALHLHDTSITDVNWLVKNVTYRENCYMCINKDGFIYFHFWSTPPQNPDCPWRLVKTERANSGNVDLFDQRIYNNLTIVLDDPVSAYPSINVVWKRFLQTFDQAGGLIYYAPVFRDYFYEALQEFCDDNVQYLEFRGLLPTTYELNGQEHDQTWALKVYDTIFKQFTSTNKQKFSGGKFIYSSLRIYKEKDILGEVIKSLKFIKQFPDTFAGYDLVGQEDPGIPLLDYLDALLYPSQQSQPLSLPYFFHAGETDWEGTPTDRNLVDAVLLNTSRIGHGYAIVKHPAVLQMAKTKNIAIEVNPISNQVLKLVDDLRNHPAAALIAENYPVVISADDPALWGARGLSYDFYMAFMGLSGENSDLRLLKQLAINSIMYSAMTANEKAQAMDLWKLNWSHFIQQILQENQNLSSYIRPGPPFG
ncbi:hypothetical protein FSP39_009001 [Pinctada imbricata]|uniref:adenosine deaminase n=1 Tax=Pinctada imbricata TaxID=66713 RepID=A0AA88YBP3_PINIB|nr:hypothetical protein FSP39_009001 [Pinctada imbricata]